MDPISVFDSFRIQSELANPLCLLLHAEREAVLNSTVRGNSFDLEMELQWAPSVLTTLLTHIGLVFFYENSKRGH